MLLPNILTAQLTLLHPRLLFKSEMVEMFAFPFRLRLLVLDNETICHGFFKKENHEQRYIIIKKINKKKPITKACYKVILLAT